MKKSVFFYLRINVIPYLSNLYILFIILFTVVDSPNEYKSS